MRVVFGSLTVLLLSVSIQACVGDSAGSTENPANSGSDAGNTGADGAGHDGGFTPSFDGGGIDTTDAGDAAQVCANVNFQTDAKNCGTCGHDCLGGMCAGGTCQPSTVSTGQVYVSKIIATGTKVYWSRTPSGGGTGAIIGADANGQNAAALFDAGTSGYCNSMTVGASDAFFYCTGHIYRCSLPSCNMVPTAILDIINVSDAALDAVNARVYFSVYTTYNQQAGGFVGSVAIAGGAMARLTAVDQPSPTSITISGGNVFWVNGGTYLNDNGQLNGGVRSAPFGTNSTVTNVASDGAGMDYSGIAVDGNNAYYGGLRAVRTAPTVGGIPTTYAATLGMGNPTALIVDSSYVYWGEPNANGGLYRCEKNCTKPTPLVLNQHIVTIAQDAKSIYWATASGTISRLAK